LFQESKGHLEEHKEVQWFLVPLEEAISEGEGIALPSVPAFISAA